MKGPVRPNLSPRPRLAWRGRRYETFTVLGWTAVATGAAVHVATGATVLGDLGIALAGAAGGFAAALVLAVAVALRAGRPVLVYTHLAGAALAGVAAVAMLAGEPVLPWLACAAPALLVLLAVGRVGCHHSGCCVGRRSAWGVAYDPGDLPIEVVRAHGRGPYLPVQLIESVAVATLGLAALLAFAAGAAAGVVLGVAVGGYGVVRLATEALRAAEGRAHLGPFVHAVWTAYAMSLAGAALAWPAAAAAAVLLLGHAGLLVHLWIARRSLQPMEVPQ